MRFSLLPFVGKETYLGQTLLAHGHTPADRVDETDCSSSTRTFRGRTRAPR
jgi:hypothetical protein